MLKYLIPNLLILCGLSACVSKSLYKKSLASQSELAKTNETYTRYLADTKRELTKTKAEYQTFETHSQTLLSESAEKEADLKKKLAEQTTACNEKVRILQAQSAEQNAQQNQALQAFKAQTQLEQAIQTRNQNLLQYLQDSFLVLDTAQISLEIYQQKVYIRLSEGFLFKKNSKYLEKTAREPLSKLTNYLQQNPDLHISVLAHAQSEKDTPENLKLANYRAQNVGLFLIEKNLDPSKILTFGRAHYQPARLLSPEEALKNAACVEFILSVARIF
jgi:outer membrane protein OmpA-like peptidoglycan-associated protein